MSVREICYAVLAVLGLVGPWFFNLQFMAQNPGSFDLLAFFGEGFTSAATSSMTVDLFIAFAAFAIFVVAEARRVGMRYGWAYVVLGFFVAFACAFPLFLCLRERHLRRNSGQPA